MEKCTIRRSYFCTDNTPIGWRNPKWLDQKLRNQLFCKHDETRSTQNFYFRLFSFVLKKPHVDPKTNFSWWDELGSLGLRGISPTLNKTATNPEKLMLCLLLSIQKSLFQNFQSSQFRWTTQNFAFHKKNPERLHVTIFCFRNGHKLVQTS